MLAFVVRRTVADVALNAIQTAYVDQILDAVYAVAKEEGWSETARAHAALCAVATAGKETAWGMYRPANAPDWDQVNVQNDCGMFQQRMLAGWYSTKIAREDRIRQLVGDWVDADETIHDVTYATRTFLLGCRVTQAAWDQAKKEGTSPSGPVGYVIPGVKQVRDWQNRTLSDVCHQVQKSAYPITPERFITEARAQLARYEKKVQMPFRGKYVWDAGTTVLEKHIRERYSLARDAVFTYDGHGGSREDPLQCIDVWSTDKAFHDRVLRYLLPQMRQCGIHYIVSWERIYSQTYPQDIFDAAGNPKGRQYRHTLAGGASLSDAHRNHLHISRYAFSIVGMPTMGSPTPPPPPVVPWAFDVSVFRDHWKGDQISPSGGTRTVTAFQERLKARGYDVDKTGIVDAKTRAAAERFAWDQKFAPPADVVKAVVAGAPFTVKD